MAQIKRLLIYIFLSKLKKRFESITLKVIYPNYSYFKKYIKNLQSNMYSAINVCKIENMFVQYNIWLYFTINENIVYSTI